MGLRWFGLIKWKRMYNSDHHKRKEMILRAAKLSMFVGEEVNDYEELPKGVRRFFSSFRYEDIVTPLIRADREALGLTYGQLGIKYGLKVNKIEYIFCCKRMYSTD